MKKHIHALGKTALVGAAALALFNLFTHFVPYSLVWNRTASVPLGLYLAEEVTGDELQRGDLGCFAYQAPSWAKDRKYFPDGFKLCKPVAAVAGDTYALLNGKLMVRHQATGRELVAGEMAKADSAGRALPQNALDAAVLQPGQMLLVAGAHANSLDSRYLGVIATAQVKLRLYPLWTY